MKTSTIIRSLTLILLATLSAPAMATYPDITGTWFGTSYLQDTSCSGGWTPESWTEQTTLTFSNQSGGSFDVDLFTIDPEDGVSFSDSSTGGFTTPSTLIISPFSGTLSDGPDLLIDNINAQVSGNTMTVTFDFHEDDGPDSCDGVGTATLHRDTGVIQDPAEAPGSEVTNNAQTLATSVSTTTGFLGTRVQAALGGNRHTGVSRAGRGYMLSGLAAGDSFDNLGMWASYARTNFENDFFRTEYDGDTDTFFVGADYTPKDNMVLGLAIGYEDTDLDTDFNLGQADADGFTIAPYFGMTLDETWNFDASGGWSSIDTDQYRTSAGTRITSDVNTRRWFLAANFNGFTTIDRWNLSGRVGAMTATGTDEKFSESDGTTIAERDSDISQFNIGGEAAYVFDEFEPFVGATYNYDMTKTETQFTTGKQPSSDDSDFLLSFGFRYFAESGLTMSAQYDTRQGREDYDEDSFNFTARWDF